MCLASLRAQGLTTARAGTAGTRRPHLRGGAAPRRPSPRPGAPDPAPAPVGCGFPAAPAILRHALSCPYRLALGSLLSGYASRLFPSGAPPAWVLGPARCWPPSSCSSPASAPRTATHLPTAPTLSCWARGSSRWALLVPSATSTARLWVSRRRPRTLPLPALVPDSFFCVPELFFPQRPHRAPPPGAGAGRKPGGPRAPWGALSLSRAEKAKFSS